MAESENFNNPYVGPVPFGIEHKDLFFGRDGEANLLYARTIAERIVLFYAESGSGKTSIINTRLLPALTTRYQVLPVVRVGRDLPPKLNYDGVYNVYTFNILSTLAGNKLKQEELTSKPLVSLKKENLLEIDYERPHWLIIDQFEEIVTTHLVQRGKRADFFDQLRDLLEEDKYLSLLLVIREDYLADIYDYAPHLPGRLNVRLRMTALNRKGATDAIRKPAEKAGRNFSPEAVKLIVDDLSQLRVADREQPIIGEHVEPLNLQIVCYTFWERLNAVAKTGEDTTQITEAHVKEFAKVDEVLESYYDEILQSVAEKSSLTEAELRRWIGDTLITPSGIRAQVNRGFFRTGTLPNKAVDFLHEAHLLRVEEVRGGKWYELSHDRFVTPILQSNAKWTAETKSELSVVAQAWDRAKHDESFLLRGHVLEIAQKDYLPQLENLSPVERDFLTASINANISRARKNYGGLIALILVALVVAGFSLKRSFDLQAKNRAYEQEQARFNQQREITAELLNRLGITSGSEFEQEVPAPSPSPSPSIDVGSAIFTEETLVGPVRWRLLSGGIVEYVDHWDTANIVTVDIPQLRNVKNANNGRIQFNRQAAKQLKDAWAEVEAAGLMDRVLFWNGSLARKAVGGRLSSHALGFAFDINYDNNPTGVAPPYPDETGSVRDLVPIFKKHGFLWGGDWRVPDGGHFQVSEIKP
jgi:D-alanyl-D-alanine carboxypeptidase